MHKATPGVHRSLRQIAEKHVQPSNVQPLEGYDVAAGVPTPVAGGTYSTAVADQAHARDGAPAPATKSPFKLGGK